MRLVPVRDSFLGRVLRAPIDLLPRGMLVRILSGPARGMWWVLGSGSYSMAAGTYEYRFARLFREAVRQGDCVYDIGSYAGYYTLIAGRAGARTVAFEPVPANVVKVRRHAELNRLGTTVIDAAVCGESGWGRFSVSAGPTQGSLEMGGASVVRTVSIDDLVASGGAPPPQLMKLDIEGGEVDALRGARATLQAYRPAVFLEIHRDEDRAAVRDLLVPMRYEVEDYPGAGMICRPRGEPGE